MSDDLTNEDAMRVLRSVPGSAINSTSLEHQAVAIKVAREWWQAFQPIIRARLATAEADALERAEGFLDEIADIIGARRGSTIHAALTEYRNRIRDLRRSLKPKGQE